MALGTEHAQMLTDTSNLTTATPEEAIVSGVVFKRSKNGNLVRTADMHQGFVLAMGYMMFSLLTGLAQTTPAERKESTMQTIHFDRYPSPVSLA
jgi:hypothetical protein